MLRDYKAVYFGQARTIADIWAEEAKRPAPR